MEQMSLTPEVLNDGLLSVDFIMQYKDAITDFFGDNREWYTKLIEGNTVRSYDVGANKDGIVISGPKPLLWLHSEYDLQVDKENPPLNPLLINEGKAELIAKFFKKNVDAENAFLLYSKSYKKNYKSPDQTLASHL